MRALNLDDDEFELYQKVYADLAPQAPTPDLVIYLQAPIDALQERVKRRGVDFERGMDAGYLQRLANSYSEFFHRYEAAPLLIVNTEQPQFRRERSRLRAAGRTHEQDARAARILQPGGMR